VVVYVYGQFDRKKIVYHGDYVILGPGQSWYYDIAEKVPRKAPAGEYQVQIVLWDSVLHQCKGASFPVDVTVLE
jgi:hypothetical protein